MRLQQRGRHGERVVEVGEGGAREIAARASSTAWAAASMVGRWFRRRGVGPGEVVVDDAGGVAVVDFSAGRTPTHPGHVHGRGQHAEVVEGGVGHNE